MWRYHVWLFIRIIYSVQIFSNKSVRLLIPIICHKIYIQYVIMYHKISCSIHNSMCKVDLPLKLVVELTKGNCYYTNASFFFCKWSGHVAGHRPGFSCCLRQLSWQSMNSLPKISSDWILVDVLKTFSSLLTFKIG